MANRNSWCCQQHTLVSVESQIFVYITVSHLQLQSDHLLWEHAVRMQQVTHSLLINSKERLKFDRNGDGIVGNISYVHYHGEIKREKVKPFLYSHMSNIDPELSKWWNYFPQTLVHTFLRLAQIFFVMKVQRESSLARWNWNYRENHYAVHSCTKLVVDSGSSN